MKKIIVTVVFLAFFIIIPCAVTGENNKYFIGVHSGYSSFFARNYYESIRYDSEHRSENKLGFYAGANFQYRFSPHWTIQLEMDYQRGTHFEEFIDYVTPEYNHSRTEDTSYKIYYLNAVYTLLEIKERKFFPYFLAGVGIRDTKPFILYSKIEIGIKYSFLTRLALHAGVTFWPFPFMLLEHYGIRLYLQSYSINIGLEYGL